MITKGLIHKTVGNVAYAVLYNDEDEKQYITIPLPEDWHEFNIREGVEVTMYNGDDAKHEDGSVTPVIILTHRDKSLILQMREEEDKSLTVMSGTICDKEAIDNAE